MTKPESHALGRPQKATRAAIVQAAWALFEEVGFDAASMSAIADGSGVSRRTLFNHFPHKADLLFQGWEEFMEEFRAELERQPEDTPLLVMLANSFWALAPRADELDAQFRPGPTVLAARLRPDNVAHWKSQWGRHMEELVLDLFGPDYRMKAGFIGALAAQGWAAFIGQQAPTSGPVRADAAMARVITELSEALGVSLPAAMAQ